MGKRRKQTPHQRRYTNGQQVYEKALNITIHQVNANQSHEISLTLVQMAVLKKTRDEKCW